VKLDKALEFAVILAWEDLKKSAAPCSVRVEYRCAPGISLDYLNVWSVKSDGRQNLVCDFWTWTSSAHPGGIRFRNGCHSDRLAQGLNFIMKNQERFTRPADACPDGLVLIQPPNEGERTEAARWMGQVPAAATSFGAATDETVPLSRTSLTASRPESGLL
jgi:hypothetical protein